MSMGPHDWAEGRVWHADGKGPIWGHALWRVNPWDVLSSSLLAQTSFCQADTAGDDAVTPLSPFPSGNEKFKTQV